MIFWYFALNDGNGTFTKQLACTSELYDQETSKDDDFFSCYVYDFDFDGKSDVVIKKSMFVKKSDTFGLNVWWSFDKTVTSWMRSTGTGLTEAKSITSGKWDDGSEKFGVIGDFNGDGQIELMDYAYNSSDTQSWRIYKNPYLTVGNGKVASITSGYGSSTTISYSSFTNENTYTKGTGSSYPVIDCTLPIHAVKTTGLDTGYGTMNVNYQYAGLKIHAQGKGLIGMKSQTATNTTTNTVTESGIRAWNTTFYVPSQTYTKTTVDGATAETGITLTVTDKGSKKYFAYPNTKTETDLDGNTATTTYKFNTSYGYITEEKTEYGGSNMYQTIQYDNYIQAGGTMLNKPRLITNIRKHPDDASTFTQKTYFTYDTSKGYPTQVIENYASSLPRTIGYTYDTFGNVLTSVTTGSDITPVTSYYIYDATGRFVAKTYTSPAAAESRFTYDTWGNVLTETDASNSSNMLTVTHTYNGWGQKTSTLFPDGNKKTYSRGWNNNANKRYFILTQASGQPWVKTWYDKLGRETLVETAGPKGMAVSTSNTYNNKGELTTTVAKQGSLTITDNFTYDNRGRIISQSSSSGKNITYSYGNRSATTTSNGQNYTKTYDAWGGIKSSSDPKTTVTYLYKSLGKPKTITASGAAFSITYDNVGNQVSLTDPDAGTSTYTYDAAGRLKKQTDGNGMITEVFYDALGRKSYSILDGVRTDYTYGTSGYDLNRLKKLSLEGNSITYSYDKYGRTIGEKREMGYGNTVLEYTFAYNTNGQLQTTTYPGNLQVKNEYDSYGNLVKVLAGTQAIWELTGNTGLVTTTKQGDSMTATATYNSQGLLTQLKTVKGNTTIRDLNYVFNSATGNLTSRTGMMAQKETFYYDPIDRLTTVKQGAPEVEVMSIGYADNGNIASKTGIGTYSYLSSKPHAIESVDNTGGLISEKEQSVRYTAFNKVEHLTEGEMPRSYFFQLFQLENEMTNKVYDLNIMYGPDQQRWETYLDLTVASSNSKYGFCSNLNHIIFAPNYEKIIANNGVKKQELYYISGGDGLAAVYVKEPEQADKIYYVHTDHLGSIIKLTGADGTAVFEASYDAWGNQTVTNNTFEFHRGYTGHEHLPEFGLINMNGRMYDPVLGRFLSPDPFVQAPEFSQNFNRYAYCLNNPFKYTDPSGYVFGVDDALIILAMAYFGGMQANFAHAAEQGTNPFNPGNWNWGSAHTYIGIAGGAMGGAGMAGYAIPYTQVPGMLPNGALQAGIQVTLNGIGNLTDDRKFFDNWYWSAGMGFASGVISGYGLAKEKGLNYWWGNSVKHGRTQWSFFTSELPITYTSPVKDNFGNVNGECALRSFEEFSRSYGMDEYNFEYWYQQNGNKLGVNPNEVKKVIEGTNIFHSERIIPDAQSIADAFSQDKRVMMGFTTKSGGAHAVYPNKVKIYPSSGRYKIYFSETSPVRLAPYSSTNLIKDLPGAGFWTFFK